MTFWKISLIHQRRRGRLRLRDDVGHLGRAARARSPLAHRLRPRRLIPVIGRAQPARRAPLPRGSTLSLSLRTFLARLSSCWYSARISLCLASVCARVSPTPPFTAPAIAVLTSASLCSGRRGPQSARRGSRPRCRRRPSTPAVLCPLKRRERCRRPSAASEPALVGKGRGGEVRSAANCRVPASSSAVAGWRL